VSASRPRRAWHAVIDSALTVVAAWHEALTKRAVIAGRGAVLTGGVAIGLFASNRLGAFIPDQLAADVCMFGAGVLAGVVLGLSVRRRRQLPPAL
jgi:hypothetical protein